MKKKNPHAISLDDVIKASRRGSREAEFQTLGPGFHSSSHVHVSKKNYTRKRKHRNRNLDD